MKRLRNHYALVAILTFAPMTSSCFLLPLLGMMGLTDGAGGALMLADDGSTPDYPYRVRASNAAMKTPDSAKLYGNY